MVITSVNWKFPDDGTSKYVSASNFAFQIHDWSEGNQFIFRIIDQFIQWITQYVMSRSSDEMIISDINFNPKYPEIPAIF